MLQGNAAACHSDSGQLFSREARVKKTTAATSLQQISSNSGHTAGYQKRSVSAGQQG
jgi:hypothetical protein